MSSNNDKSATAPSADIAQTLGIDQSADRRRRYLKWGAGAVIVIVAVLVVLQWLGNNDSQAVRYQTAEVTRGTLTVTVTATGTVHPTPEPPV